MRILQTVLGNLLCRGKVSVQIEGISEECLQRPVREEALAKLSQIQSVLSVEVITAEEKLDLIQKAFD